MKTLRRQSKGGLFKTSINRVKSPVKLRDEYSSQDLLLSHIFLSLRISLEKSIYVLFLSFLKRNLVFSSFLFPFSFYQEFFGSHHSHHLFTKKTYLEIALLEKQILPSILLKILSSFLSIQQSISGSQFSNEKNDFSALIQITTKIFFKITN